MRDPEITELLAAWHGGRSEALDELIETTYRALRRLASRMMADERKGHTLQPTALVHEAWRRLAASEAGPALRDRQHFYNIAGRVMRRVLVDHARRRDAARRGGAALHVDLTGAADVIGEDGARPVTFLALEEAMNRLERLDPRRTRVVELHCFAGLTLSETAELLGIGEATVYRDWRLARAFLQTELTTRTARSRAERGLGESDRDRGPLGEE